MTGATRPDQADADALLPALRSIIEDRAACHRDLLKIAATSSRRRAAILALCARDRLERADATERRIAATFGAAIISIYRADALPQRAEMSTEKL